MTDFFIPTTRRTKNKRIRQNSKRPLGMRIRVRGPSGSSTLNLEDSATVGDLRAQIKNATSLSIYDIKYGYPPKPLYLGSDAALLSSLDSKLDGEQLTISSQYIADVFKKTSSETTDNSQKVTSNGDPESDGTETQKAPLSLKRKPMEAEVPEIALPDRGATLVMRVMPDDNSCLFRAFGTAVLPGDDLSMTELRSLVASAIQGQPEIFTKVVLEQNPDDYCRWIQTEEAWGGAIELGILSKHFDIEICSIDVQSLRIDKFNEGRATRCILVYSGIHYDTIVQSPSDPPHLKSDAPPELDKRVWDSDDDAILIKAQELGKKLQEQHYFTDTGGMAIKCNECGWVGYGQGQASGHAIQLGHYDMEEVKN